MVLIEWHDSKQLDGAWLSVDDVKERMTADALRHESIGYVTHEDEHMIALANSRSLCDNAHEQPNDLLGGVWLIPRSAIVRGPVKLRASKQT